MIMPKIDERKLENYANKLYKGLLKKYKEKLQKNTTFSFNLFLEQEKKPERESLTDGQKSKVRKNCENKCVICGKRYKDPHEFQYHHVDGNSTRTLIRNLVLLCNRCHRKVHSEARVKLKEYKVRNRDKLQRQGLLGDFGIASTPKVGIPDVQLKPLDLDELLFGSSGKKTTKRKSTAKKKGK